MWIKQLGSSAKLMKQLKTDYNSPCSPEGARTNNITSHIFSQNP